MPGCLGHAVSDMLLTQTDAVVLCGGLGTRLRGTIGGTQKTMARMGERPFLDLILLFLKKSGFRRVILSTGYQARAVEAYYRENSLGLTMDFCREETPLGTGGAVKHVRPMVKSDPFIVLNGDSFCPLDYSAFFRFHQEHNALATIVVSKVSDPKDFGAVRLEDDQRIREFREKPQDSGAENRKFEQGYVNAGIYCLARSSFAFMPQAACFSIEKEFFPRVLQERCYGFPVLQTFTDIGTPERYREAQQVMEEMMKRLE
jgi:NDP-sugar pyrophosphorylase family protein